MQDSKLHKSIRSQSAMEYLMTYGWSILIITVILGALYSVGAFGSSNLGPRAPPGNCKVFRSSGEANLEGTCGGVLPESVAQFNGQSSYIQLPSTARQTGAFTFSFWVNPVSWMNNQYQSLFGGCALCGGNSGGIALTNSTDAKLHFEIYNSINDQVLYITHANTPPTGSWSFITVSWDGTAGASAVKYYENGVLLQSGAGVLGPIVWGSYNLDIGARSAPNYWFDGSIADFQIYNTSLDANQIQTLYIKGIGAAPVDPYHIVGWWPLNANATDYSGNNNAGVATNVIYTGSWLSGYTPP